ncbi:efflux RND transporter periplasmic adaptor subunit [Roseibium sp.]|uniref:efflux RND transporter periplasmic adaptor subunit n=1 Tax=Roseibium sp. TaxID=1936156 RepID=UPI003A973AAE
MRFLTRGLIGIFILATVVAALGYGAYRISSAFQKQEARGRPPVSERVYSVNVSTLTAETVEPVTTAYGEIRSWRSLEIRSSSEGRLVAAAEKFRDGASVRKGELLMRIDPADAQSSLLDAQAALADAEAQKVEAEEAVVGAEQELDAARKQLGLRRQALERQTQLREKGYSTMAQVEAEELSVAALEQSLSNRLQSVITARKKIERMELSVARARITVEDAERTLAETTIAAPFDGTLDQVNATLGRRVSPSETLAVLIDPAALEVSFALSTRQFARFLDDRGQLINAELEADLALGERIVTATGRLDRAAAVVAEGEAGRSVFASLDLEADTPLRPGDFVTVRLREPSLVDVARIPAAAATENGQILIVDEENRLQDITVKVIRRMGDELIVTGAPFGRPYVRERMPHLGSGLKVVPRAVGEDGSLLPGADDGEAKRGDPRGAGQSGEAGDMVELEPARRQELIAQLSRSPMPDEVKSRLIDMLNQPKVSSKLLNRIESRGGRG